MAKRKIIAFLAGPKDAQKRSTEKFDVYTSDKNGGTYAVAIVEGYFDEQENCIMPEDFEGVWGTEEFLKKHLKLGTYLMVRPKKEQKSS